MFAACLHNCTLSKTHSLKNGLECYDLSLKGMYIKIVPGLEKYKQLPVF